MNCPYPAGCSTQGKDGLVSDETHLDLERVLGDLERSYNTDGRAQRIGRQRLPSRDVVIEILELAFQIFYPGFYGRQDLTEKNWRYHIGSLLSTFREKLENQIEISLCYGAESENKTSDGCSEHARKLAGMIVSKLPALREVLVSDIQAAYDGDPAAGSLDEVVLSYPGVRAITVHRIAHQLHVMGVPMLPRIMTEWAHSTTGADIHPGATIGKRFFIDHATGVVIGETSHIGEGVKVYQGVTLGAISHPRDDEGNIIRNAKRHPTVENDVTLYANATVLGGNTVVGEGCIVGGSVFITKSIPARTRVGVKAPELKVLGVSGPASSSGPSSTREGPTSDFEI